MSAMRRCRLRFRSLGKIYARWVSSIRKTVLPLLLDPSTSSRVHSRIPRPFWQDDWIMSVFTSNICDSLAYSMEIDMPTPYVVAWGRWPVSKCSRSKSYLPVSISDVQVASPPAIRQLLPHGIVRPPLGDALEHETTSEELHSQLPNTHQDIPPRCSPKSAEKQFSSRC
jgi:hypothetical protein